MISIIIQISIYIAITISEAKTDEESYNKIMKVYIWPLLVSFITILAGLTLFFFAFCSSFDFRYPIYCDVFDFNGPGRIDQAEH
jgi:hypothetical protein